VGENDAREFIARLNQMYLKKRSDPERRTFLGLISIGHSFGAHVLLRATASTLEQQLISLNAPSGYLEREAERKALGVDGEHVHHVTHRIEPVDSRERLIKEELDLDAEPACDDDGVCEADWRVWAGLKDRRILEEVPSRDDTQADRERLRGFDFAGQVRLGSVEMNPGTQATPYQPLIVATSGDAIIDNHSGIFTQPLLRFLIPYIALIETKLALNPIEDIEQKQRALAT
jgi:hypothetical protein